MIIQSKITLLPVIAAVALSGCATVGPEVAFDDVAANVSGRTGKTVVWDTGSDADLIGRGTVNSIMGRSLTADGAVQVALLNNRKLQSVYTDIGIAQAAIVQASTPKNPVVDGAVSWFNDAGGSPNLAFGVAWSFIDLLYIPLRKSVAESELEEAKIRVAGAVIEHAGDTRVAYYDYVASRQEIELFWQVVRSTRASVAAAKTIRQAGNITALQFDQQQTQLTRAKLQLAQSQVRASGARERLNVLMGLSGNAVEWRAPIRLPELPGRELSTDNVEPRVIEASLDIEAGRQRLTTLGRRFNLVRRSSLVPELDLGKEYEREVEVEEDGKNIREAFGPTFGFEIPIFDRGQAEKANARMQIIKAEHDLWALAIQVRSAARLARARLLVARKTAGYYRDAILPETARILNGTQKDFNAMQEDIFGLLRAKRDQIAVGQQYIQALREYWTARARYQQFLNGKLPGRGGGGGMQMAAVEGGGGGEEH